MTDPINLPYNLKLRTYQKPVWDFFMSQQEGLRGLTIWPRRNGKDLVALNILVAKAIQKVGLYLYVAPFQVQVRSIIWTGADDSGRRFLDYIPPQLVRGKRNAQMEVDLVNPHDPSKPGSIIKLIGSDRVDGQVGQNAVGMVFTEYSLQNPEAWDYLRPMLAANGGWALFNSTVRQLNHLWPMAKMAEKNPKWFYQYLTRDDTNHPSLEAIDEERKAGMKESKIQQEFWNDWNTSNEDTFVPLEGVAKSMSPEAAMQPKAYQHSAKIFGCDVAYSATGDKASIGYRQGKKVHFVRWYLGKDNMAFADEIHKLILQIKPDMVFVDAGRGEGVISRLLQLGHGDIVVGVHFGGKVYEEGIANMKALMWSRMADFFADPAGPDMYNLDESPYANEEVEEMLVKEITMPLMLIDEKNRISVESKRALKARGENSPDLAEAIALTFAEEIEDPIELSEELRELGVDKMLVQELLSQQRPYDPLNYMQGFQ